LRQKAAEKLPWPVRGPAGTWLEIFARAVQITSFDAHHVAKKTIQQVSKNRAKVDP
jgi:hypothetical protein